MRVRAPYPTIVFFMVTLFLFPNILESASLSVENGQEIVGQIQKYTVKHRDTLIDIAPAFDLGYNEIVMANKNTDPWIPKEGSEIIIPSRWILPFKADTGIVINLAEMRLYYFYKLDKKTLMKSYPMGIGREGYETPIGDFSVTAKVKDPVWSPPQHIRDEHARDGDILPPFVMPGPDNPLGGYWLNLSIEGYGIHGTHKPLGIGRRVSSGCMRLYPSDIASLFQAVQPGTKVKIMDEPVKIGVDKNDIYIEVHNSYKGDKDTLELSDIAIEKIRARGLSDYVDTKKLITAVKDKTGIPTLISK
ncbi:ErfK/YbiS/YcfS/YnhG family protein [Candidatus Magnetoovum chiemensis]|nr:ErfK/YbiS/YcfS/YnhG family protein [Candidatus Magnetoovum chiemensis]